ncbi:hypothetical protein EJB05_28803, partial [Eragrostis curvula]
MQKFRQERELNKCSEGLMKITHINKVVVGLTEKSIRKEFELNTRLCLFDDWLGWVDVPVVDVSPKSVIKLAGYSFVPLNLI